MIIQNGGKRKGRPWLLCLQLRIMQLTFQIMTGTIQNPALLNKTLQTCWNSGACTGMAGHSQYLSASILDGWVQISY